MDVAKQGKQRRQGKRGEQCPQIIDDLIKKPPSVESAFSELTMFVSLWDAVLGHLKIPFDTFIGKVEPVGKIKALNSNFEHKAQPGWEAYIKRPESLKKKRRKSKKYWL